MSIAEFDRARELYYARCTGCHSMLREGTAGSPLTPQLMRDRGTEYLQTVINYGSSFLDEKARQKRMAAWKARKAFEEQEGLGRHDPKLRTGGVVAGEPAGCVASVVVAAVVDQNDLKFAGIILSEQ